MPEAFQELLNGLLNAPSLGVFTIKLAWSLPNTALMRSVSVLHLDVETVHHAMSTCRWRGFNNQRISHSVACAITTTRAVVA